MHFDNYIVNNFVLTNILELSSNSQSKKLIKGDKSHEKMIGSCAIMSHDQSHTRRKKHYRAIFFLFFFWLLEL